MKSAAFVFLLGTVLAMSAGCGTNSSGSCAVTGIHITPATATADHAAAAPGNAAQFVAVEDRPSGCAGAAVVTYNENWTVSDPAHATISNAHDSTYGTATCTGTAAGPITVTATMTSAMGQTLSATATLTCK